MFLGRLSARLWGGVAAAALAVAVTGCSASGGGSTTEAAACDSPGVTADQVKIGLVVTDSGPGSAAFDSARSGVDARIGLANQEGGIHGRQIVYEWRDDANSPSQNANVTTSLVQQDSVFGLLTVTAALGDSLDRLAAQQVPVVGFAQPDWGKYQNFFTYLYAASPDTIGRYIQASGGTKVAFVTTGTSAFTLQVMARYQAAFRAIGLGTTDAISYASSTDSPARVVQQISAAGADSMIGFTTSGDFAAIAQAARAAHLDLSSSVALTGYDHGLLPTLGPALSGVSFPVYFRPFEAGGAAIDRYRAAMTRFAPETFVPEQQFAMHAYIYTDMFLRGLELAGPCPTREGFISALRKVSNYDAGGLIAPINLGNNASQPLNCYAFVKINPAGNAFQVVHERLCADGTGN
ncbi:amino acid-binding protein [Parafrankia soli]|uniref:Amino acid-binding protein n=1 Tax=Parafrankia soli TaxID=2599596 RepID=A0A1S1PP62_9ACTN|nr:ABC transporter substrate-binding protein [Parafrankia soli]OHV22979.1 amino acid-binding protein [Parafrankia soli]